MIATQGVDKNFRFMVLEVTKQLENTYKVIQEPSRALIHKILTSDNYIDILKGLIEKKCISFFRHSPTIGKQSADMVSAVSTVTNNLERIADFCVNVAQQIQLLKQEGFLHKFFYKAYFDEILEALTNVDRAVFEQDTTAALRLCHTEVRLNKLYEDDYDRIKTELRAGQNTDDLLAALYICHYLERIGDSLLNIGEAMLFAVTGEKLKIKDYMALDEALGCSQTHLPARDYAIECQWETKSGSRIGKIRERTALAGDVAPTSDREAIFKEGNSDKLRLEKENIERWEAIMPGLPPKVLDFRNGNGEAALLMEFLDGFTFQDLVLGIEPSLMETALTLTEETLMRAWTITRKGQPVNGGYLDQLRKRLDDIFRVHPKFRLASRQVGSLSMQSFDDLLERANAVDAQLQAPFSVLIHGDFNTDNIIYNPQTHRIHFIDLHRSRDMDYVQDVSVFLVSNFRMPVFKHDLRERLNGVIESFFHFADDFATAHGDETFQARLALALARSFITSTRFEIKEDFAKVMHLRAIYLLERVIEHSGRPWKDFKLTLETLMY